MCAWRQEEQRGGIDISVSYALTLTLQPSRNMNKSMAND
jgi:hypothetical protein